MTLQIRLDEPSAFDCIAEVLLPLGGITAVIVEAYFDESSGSANAMQPDGVGAPCKILCVAGYLFENEKRKQLEREWNEVLAWKNLPYFHMVDCAHRNGPFANLSKPECIQVEARMIGIIKRYAIKGFVIGLNEDQYRLFMPVRHPLAGEPYTFCVQGAIGAITAWANQASYSGEIAYFFESGHQSQGQSNQLMAKIFADPGLKEMTRYAGHAFVEKRGTPGAQAADLLAWQFYTDIRRQMERIRAGRRKDLESLLAHDHEATYVSPWIMVRIAKAWGYDTAKAEALLQGVFGDDYPQTGTIDFAAVNAFWRLS